MCVWNQGNAWFMRILLSVGSGLRLNAILPFLSLHCSSPFGCSTRNESTSYSFARYKVVKVCLPLHIPWAATNSKGASRKGLKISFFGHDDTLARIESEMDT